MPDPLFRFLGMPTVVLASGVLTHNTYGLVDHLAADMPTVPVATLPPAKE